MQAFAAPEVSSLPTRTATVVRVDERSGRLVRSVRRVADQAANPAGAWLNPAVDVQKVIQQIAGENGVEESLVHSVIRAESNYNFLALSPKGAQGLMQLIPSTAKRFGVENAFDIRQNVSGGVKYLKFLLDYYQGDYARTIAAYNAGEEAVDRYHGVPPYPETRNYVFQVARNLKAARLKLAQSSSPEPATTVSRQASTIQAVVGQDGKVYYRTP